MSFEEFINVYSVSKTLRFELRPVGCTAQKLAESSLFASDKRRSEDYQALKNILDEQHKKLLAEALEEEVVTQILLKPLKSIPKDVYNNEGVLLWDQLATALKDFHDKKMTKADLSAVQKKFRKTIVEVLKEHALYVPLTKSTPSDLLKALLKEEGHSQVVETFKGFACYFIGFQENRLNIYSPEQQATAAATRIVHDNFPKFLTQCQIVNTLATKYPEILQEATQELEAELAGESIVDLFKVDQFSRWMTQRGIDRLNTLIGGTTLKDGKKIKGLNECINLYRQQHEAARTDRALAKMPVLFKQILSDRTTSSFIPEMFEDDHAVKHAIVMFLDSLKDFDLSGQRVNVIDALGGLLAGIPNAHAGLYLTAKSLTAVSKEATGDWGLLSRAMEAYAETAFKTKKDRATWLKKEAYTLDELCQVPLQREMDDKIIRYDLLSYWSQDKLASRISAVQTTAAALGEVFERIDTTTEDTSKLRERVEDVATIKTYLDAIEELLHYVKPLDVSSDFERDANFYADFEQLYRQLETIVPLYNRVRNYMTQKISAVQTMKLMFDVPTLADGWDENKVDDNKTILLTKDGSYFLGILNPKVEKKLRPKFGEKPPVSDVACYQKVVYKLLQGPNRMLPKVFFSKSNQALYAPSENLVKRFQNGDYKKGESFDLDFCHELIDFFKVSIKKNPDWQTFNFQFQPTESYQGIDGFYRDIERQGYKMSFEPIAEEQVNTWVAEGKLFLFQLYNKDFAPGATGKPNLHTLYWRSLFSLENLKDPVLKLCGGAELFYRPVAIKRPYIHVAGSKVVNRRLGEWGRRCGAIPEPIHKELVDDANGELQRPLSVEAMKYKAQATIKEVTHDLIKDRRYTEEKYFFHVPIMFNRIAGKVRNFNVMVQDYLKEHPEMNIIGLDRGERNLLYLTLLSPQGKILKQHSFNIVGNVNYLDKLEQREKERKEARVNWESVGQIKDLKSGYLSAVIHEIVTMMIDRHAIIVMEDLSGAFKRLRVKFERQVYQKFEKMLIDKLNFLALKDTKDASAPGGIFRAYQLTDKFESFKKMCGQCGFLFYVPAAYTSNIDPTTGFTNLFNTQKCTNAEGYKAFFERMDSIVYDSKYEAFAFTFDYKNFLTRLKSHRTQWTIYSAKERITYVRAKNGSLSQGEKKTISPTSIIKDTLQKQGASVTDGFDLLAFMKKVPADKQHAAFFKDVFSAFDRTLQMRNSDAAQGKDDILSPVLNKEGKFFDSSTADASQWPCDADANGAYHIALKGLLALQRLRDPSLISQKVNPEDKPSKTEKGNTNNPFLAITHEEWFKYAQTRFDE